MKTTDELTQQLKDVTGLKYVYFQPPETVKMKYPCIVYERVGLNVKLADNGKYNKYMRYQVMYITKEPDTNEMISKILDGFTYIMYSRHFIIDSLHHDVFDLYY